MSDFEDRLRDQMHDLRDSIDPPDDLWARMQTTAMQSRRPWIPIAMVAVAAAVLLFAAIAGVRGPGGGNKIVAGPAPAAPPTTTADDGVEAPPTSQAPETTTPA